MLSYLAVVLGGAAALMIARWYDGRLDTFGRRRAFPWLAVVVLVLASGAAAMPSFRRGNRENLLASVASVLSGRPVEVHCQTADEQWVDTGDELGYVRIDEDGTPEAATVIKREQCNDLAAYLESGKTQPTIQQVLAVHVLTHEAMHMAGVLDESAAECAAVQRDATAALLLGATPGDAMRLATRYWREIYPLMPSVYRSRECAPGGRFDDDVPGAPWRFEP